MRTIGPWRQAVGQAHQRRAADRLGAKWTELDTGHYPMLSTPDRTDRAIDGGMRRASCDEHRSDRPADRRPALPRAA
jgi:hypothetical protein